MNSWRLVRNLTDSWAGRENPVFLRQAQRRPAWAAITGRLVQWPGLALVIGGVGCYLVTLMALTLPNPLWLVLPLLIAWLLLIALSVGPALVEEREMHTWEVLRATPLSLEAVILGKTGGALSWLHPSLRVMVGALVFVAAMLAVVGVVSLSAPYTDLEKDTPLLVVCGMTMLVPLLMTLAFVADRVQQFALLLAAAMAASAATRSRRMSISAAVVFMLVMWGLDAGIATLMIALRAGRTITEMGSFGVTMATLGPSAGYLARMPLESAAPVILATLAVREAVVWAVWRWTVRAASHL